MRKIIYLKSIAKRLNDQRELFVATQILAGRSIATDTDPDYPFVGAVHQVPRADQTDFLYWADSMKAKYGFDEGGTDVIMSTMYRTPLMKLAEEGEFNAVNKLNVVGGKNFYFSDANPLGAGVKYTGIVSTPEAYALGYWNENDVTKMFGKMQNGEKMIAQVPGFDMPVGMFKQANFVDGTGRVGDTMTASTRLSFACDF